MDNQTYLRAARSNYRTPGVYYETLVKVHAQPVFRTGIPVFVGFVQPGSNRKDSPEIHHIDRFQQFSQRYEPLPESYLGYAVRGFFENGGEQCVVVPLQVNPSNSSEAAKALTRIFAPGEMLENIEDVDLICVPDAMLLQPDYNAVLEIQSATLDHCHRMGDRFAILDGFTKEVGDQHSRPEENRSYVEPPVLHWQRLPREHGAFGALYYPWISVKQSLNATDSDIPRVTGMPCAGMVNRPNMEAAFTKAYRTQFAPACGHVAGVYARTDTKTGVHKAPANEVLEGILKLEVDFSDDQQAPLNDGGVNCLRSFTGRGTRVWGARTLSGHAEESYVNVRRLFLTLTRWIRQNMNDMVYEGNNPSLWERVSQRLSAYCRDLFDRGALMGSSPAEAFFVKCDAETNTLESREAGQVVALIGLAPAIPAEFIVVRITQSASAIAVTGLNVS